MGLLNSIGKFIDSNPLAAAGTAAVAGAAVGAGATAAILGSRKSSSRRKRISRKKISHTRRGLKQDRKRKSKQKWEVAYRKRKRKSSSSGRRGRVHYARKTGQPYILLANGQAKFIKGKRRKR